MKMATKVTTMMLGVALFGGLAVTSSTKAATIPQVPPITPPIGTTQTYNLNPEPALKANKGVAVNLLKTQADILSKFKFSVDHKLVSAKLLTLQEHFASQGISDQWTDVAADRMVWDVTTAHPNGVETRAGLYKNATVVDTYDAETGAPLGSRTTGDWVKGSGGPPVRDDAPVVKN
ncbi:MAG: hypothetical protein JWN15_3898 [Firmicutes bacterium]|jgi:hypothetical protein|nr:hypothetical protein [Bacillota bacterium]